LRREDEGERPDAGARLDQKPGQGSPVAVLIATLAYNGEHGLVASLEGFFLQYLVVDPKRIG
jgi:hypothetical protein